MTRVFVVYANPADWDKARQLTYGERVEFVALPVDQPASVARRLLGREVEPGDVLYRGDNVHKADGYAETIDILRRIDPGDVFRL